MDGEKGGCSAISLALAGLVVLVVAAYLVGNLAQYQDAQASRLYAEAALQDAWGRSQAQVIVAQGQARLDAAQAFAITAGASLPWLVVVVVGVAGAVLLATIVAMLALSLAALRGQQVLSGSWRMMHISAPPPIWVEQPARPTLPALQEPAAPAMYRAQAHEERE